MWRSASPSPRSWTAGSRQPSITAVLAAVSDADLGEASGINDAASRVGGVIAVALVPLLIGAGSGAGRHSCGGALTNGYRPAMLVLAGLCLVAALVSWLFVSDERAVAARIAPMPPDRGCALPVTAATATGMKVTA